MIFQVNCASPYVTSQGHGLCAHVWALISESRMDFPETPAWAHCLPVVQNLNTSLEVAYQEMGDEVYVWW